MKTEDTQPKPVGDPEAPARLTNWKAEPSLAALTRDLTASKSSQAIVIKRINTWRDIIEAKGEYASPNVTNRSHVQPRLARRQNEWRYSALSEPLLGSQKLFEAQPLTYEDVKAAEQNELVLNYQFRTYTQRVDFIDKYVRAAVDEGTAVMRVGWCREEREVEIEAPVYELQEPTEELMQQVQQALEMSEADPNGFATKAPPAVVATVDYFKETQQLLIHADTGRTEKTKVKKVVRNHPTVEIVDPRNLYVDPTCEGDASKIKFVIQAFETCRADLEATGIEYKNLDRVVWPSSEPSANGDIVSQDTSFNFHDAARKRAVAYEYWGFYDVHGNGVLVPIVATWIGNTLIRMEENPFPDKKIPFVFVSYMPVKRQLFGEADAEFLGDSQKIQGAVTRGIIDLLAKASNGQQGLAKGMLDPVNKRRKEAGQDYEYNPSMHPQQGLVEHKFSEIPQSVLGFLQMVNMDAESMTGVKAFTGGVSGESYGQVAAGIRGALDAASKREMAILRRLAAGLVEVARRWASMNGEFLEEEEVVRITNEEFVRVRREELNGQYDLVMDISTAEVDNAKSQDLGFLLQTLGPIANIELVKIILAEITRLKKMPELAKRIKEFQPEPDKHEEQRKGLENRKLEAEVRRLEAQAKEAEARAELANAQANNLDLEYVEEEQGIKHERQMEQVAAQAEAQADAQIIKAMTAPRKEGETRGNIEEAILHNDMKKLKPMASAPTVDSLAERDALSAENPSFSLGSGFFEPEQDPALNQGFNFQG